MQRLKSNTPATEVAEDLFNKYPFAILMLSQQTVDMPQISHLPFLYVKQQNAFYCHVATNNPMVAMLEKGLNTVKIVFNGEHAYLSPSWSQDIKVPTWDYCVVHVDGEAQIVEDAEKKHQSMVEQVMALDQNWQLSDLDEKLKNNLFKAIRVIRIDIKQMLYKYKMSQAKSSAAKAAIFDKLEQLNPLMVERYREFEQ